MANIQTIEDGFHHFVQTASMSLHELYVIGEAIKNDRTYEAVDKDSALSAWEKDLIKLLIFIRPVFDLIVEHYAGLKSLIEWAQNIYQTFVSQGKMPAV